MDIGSPITGAQNPTLIPIQPIRRTDTNGLTDTNVTNMRVTIGRATIANAIIARVGITDRQVAPQGSALRSSEARYDRGDHCQRLLGIAHGNGIETHFLGRIVVATGKYCITDKQHRPQRDPARFA